MASLADEFLAVAEALVEGTNSGDAVSRRVASTSYYALFHRLCGLCADQLLGAVDTAQMRRRAYRALEHRQVRSALNERDEFAAILGAPFEELQDIRHWADYSPTPHWNEQKVKFNKAFTTGDALDCLNKARDAINAIDRLDDPARRRLATLLLVRERR